MKSLQMPENISKLSKKVDWIKSNQLINRFLTFLSRKHSKLKYFDYYNLYNACSTKFGLLLQQDFWAIIRRRSFQLHFISRPTNNLDLFLWISQSPLHSFWFPIKIKPNQISRFKNNYTRFGSFSILKTGKTYTFTYEKNCEWDSEFHWDKVPRFDSSTISLVFSS